ncbi:hypothetical protein [Herbiconiux sp. YIM B11900]|uniref:hypothetical protein n=1 Tax=Herbiconiux sp. YIM B11900 TaxID=3404131 RepID=UPI003F84AB75
MRRRITATLAGAVLALVSIVGLGASAAFAAVSSADDATPQPSLAQTGYDFTPMLITAAVFLLIAGVAVVVAKYALTRRSS